MVRLRAVSWVACSSRAVRSANASASAVVNSSWRCAASRTSRRRRSRRSRSPSSSRRAGQRGGHGAGEQLFRLSAEALRGLVRTRGIKVPHGLADPRERRDQNEGRFRLLTSPYRLFVVGLLLARLPEHGTRRTSADTARRRKPAPVVDVPGVSGNL